MHTNPFSSTGYDLRDLENKIQQKADRHEIHSLRGEVDRLERSIHSADSALAGLRDRCERLEEDFRQLEQEYVALLNVRTDELREATAANGQFGVGS